MLRSHQPSLAGKEELPACRRLPDGTVAEDTAPGAERQSEADPVASPICSRDKWCSVELRKLYRE